MGGPFINHHARSSLSQAQLALAKRAIEPALTRAGTETLAQPIGYSSLYSLFPAGPTRAGRRLVYFSLDINACLTPPDLVIASKRSVRDLVRMPFF